MTNEGSILGDRECSRRDVLVRTVWRTNCSDHEGRIINVKATWSPKPFRLRTDGLNAIDG